LPHIKIFFQVTKRCDSDVIKTWRNVVEYHVTAVVTQ